MMVEMDGNCPNYGPLPIVQFLGSHGQDSPVTSSWGSALHLGPLGDLLPGHLPVVVETQTY